MELSQLHFDEPKKMASSQRKDESSECEQRYLVGEVINCEFVHIVI